MQESPHAGKTGVVRAIAGKMASVYLYDTGHEVDIPTRYLEPTAPKKLDKVCVYTYILQRFVLAVRRIAY